jgi:acetyl-CoA carboxylase biotin carboxyl carrier protein
MAGDKRSGDVFDLKRLRDLIDLMKEHDLHEVDLKQDKQHIRLARGGQVVHASPSVAAMASTPAATTPAVPSGDSGDADSGAADSGSIVTIDSPMVGTFYSRPNPDAEPFVKVGDSVGPESVVCIIEAMKVFNEIPAEVSGQVVAVLADSDEAVEFGRPLFKVDTSK